MITSEFTYIAANGIISFFLWLSSIPLCVCVHTYIYVCVYIYVYIYIYIYKSHIFLIHPYVDGHLGCIHVLAVGNSAAMNIGMHVYFRSVVFASYKPRNGIAGSYGIFLSY